MIYTVLYEINITRYDINDTSTIRDTFVTSNAVIRRGLPDETLDCMNHALVLLTCNEATLGGGREGEQRGRRWGGWGR